MRSRLSCHMPSLCICGVMAELEPVASEPGSQSVKTVLVGYRERKRPVTFRMSSDPEAERQSLLAGIRAAFSDVDWGEGEEVLQIKSENWGGEFVDLLQATIPDHAVLRVAFEGKELPKVKPAINSH